MTGLDCGVASALLRSCSGVSRFTRSNSLVTSSVVEGDTLVVGPLAAASVVVTLVWSVVSLSVVVVVGIRTCKSLSSTFSVPQLVLALSLLSCSSRERPCTAG